MPPFQGENFAPIGVCTCVCVEGRWGMREFDALIGRV